MNISDFISDLSAKEDNQVPQSLLTAMFDEEYSLSSLNISARVLQNWYNNGLLPYDDRQGRKHHFNFVELMWLYIVQELREVGMPIKTIREVKSFLIPYYPTTIFAAIFGVKDMVSLISCFNPLTEVQKEKLQLYYSDNKDNPGTAGLEILQKLKVKRLSVLLVALTEVISFENNVLLLIDKSGEVSLLNESGFNKELFSLFDQKTHVVLSLKTFFLKFISDIRHYPFLQQAGMLTEEEEEIIEKVREGDSKSINIKLQDGQIVEIDTTREIKGADMATIGRIMMSKKYVDITLKSQSGHITYAEIINKKKVKYDD
jgi:hypothetical protein